VAVRQPLQLGKRRLVQHVRGGWIVRILRRRHDPAACTGDSSGSTFPRVVEQVADGQWLEELCRQDFDGRQHQRGRPRRANP